MYCPKCGQQQISDEVRYCSRCGFAMSGVTQLVAADGVHPALETGVGKPRRSPRREGVRQGALIMFVGVCLLPLIDALHLEPLILMLFMAGFMRILYAAIFQEGAPRRKKGERVLYAAAPLTQAEARTRDAALPPAQSIHAGMFKRPKGNTSEMSPPSSVTENTTRLLDD